jgi:glutathione-regulated potassium-efflux system protein KefB
LNQGNDARDLLEPPSSAYGTSRQFSGPEKYGRCWVEADIGRAERAAAICIDNRENASRIVDMVHAEFPGVRVYVRAFDRRHSLQLIAKGVAFEVRETFESALAFGRKALEGLGLDPERAAAVGEFVRERDRNRLVVQQAEGISAGADLLRTRMVQEPLSEVARKAKPLNPEAQEIVARTPAAE